MFKEQFSHEFRFPEGIAASEGHNVYIADQGNRRIQEFEADGKFVTMFGTGVDATTKGSICTAASKDTCQVGIEGVGPGSIDAAQSLAVAPEALGGDVYVAERVFSAEGHGERVQKFTPTGEFLLEIGKEVNKSGANVCTAVEIANCQGPAPVNGAEHGSFAFVPNVGNVLAVGGPEELLYVGETERVQEFTQEGVWKGEIQLAGLAAPGAAVQALALERATGDLYLAYGTGENLREDADREFTGSGSEVTSFAVGPQQGREMHIDGMAVDRDGRLAVLAVERASVDE